MPYPSSQRSTDYYVYRYAATPLAKRLCGVVHPNVVTLAGLLLIVPIAWALVSQHVGVAAFALLVCFRFYLDCLDGEVARHCQQQSALGATLDVLTDTILFLVLNSIVLYHMLRTNAPPLTLPRMALAAVLVAVVVAHLHHTARELLNERSRTRYFTSPLEQAAHDNGMLCMLVFAVVIKYVML